ncbi:uncharacterized protein CMU_012680 [Cryptosporidium muris RN66]|uniref:Uncharacterized protein n=1 Tax=Cryptosporidium muris (strain RN66) TaxID=441375 RepID=B6AEH7_CRYMR|nr:uncharacterized protein CMU_012680 [Cryptosporidium muris RN66]EEA06594.1 hypothetical protein, conserved [Cryptosporidium muris RN66]|eukprot:XP_002140943.1 hypothetical protein [Cryptosporidium muris RN66]
MDVSKTCELTPKHEHSNEDNLGTYYKLESIQRKKEKDFIVTPVRSSCRISNFQSTPSSCVGLDKVLVITPNPYISSKNTDELLEKVLKQFEHKVRIISIDQPQIKSEIINRKSIKDEGVTIDKELYKSENSDFYNGQLEKEGTCEGDIYSEDKLIANFEKCMNITSVDKFATNPVSTTTPRSSYFICRNRPRVFLGKENKMKQAITKKIVPIPNGCKIIKQNDFWQVLEFAAGSELERRYKCRRILTRKVGSIPIGQDQPQSIEEFKRFHQELKNLLELSNYCYSPDVF